MQRKGRKKRPFYHIVVADSRSTRDGKYIERIGSYNPLSNPATITLNNDRAFEWLMKGAQPSYTARAILKFRGVLYRKHLERGVQKNAITEEQAKNLYEEFMAAKNEKIQSRMEKEAALKADKKSAVLASTALEEPEVGEEPVTEEKEEIGASDEAAEVEENTEAADEVKSEEIPAEKEVSDEDAAPAEEKKEEVPAQENKVEETTEDSKGEKPTEDSKEEKAAEESKEEASTDENEEK